MIILPVPVSECKWFTTFPETSWPEIPSLQLSWFNDISQQLDRDFTYPIALDLLFSDSRFGQQKLPQAVVVSKSDLDVSETSGVSPQIIHF